MKRLPGCSGILVFLLAAAPLLADTRFQVRRMTRGDVPLGKGQCDIRLQVDNEAEVSLRGDMVFVRTLTGRDPWDDGSECNAPLPDHEMSGFRFEVKDGRGQIRLLEGPSRGNGFAAIVAIRDPEGGAGRYHFRLSWDMRAADLRSEEAGRMPGPPGFVWNNVLHFRGVGRGLATMGDGFEQRLGDVSVDIDRGGRVVAVFRGERGRDLVFNGSVTGRDGGRWRADVVSEDRRFRGPLFLSAGDDDRIDSITLEGGDGRERLRLRWDRR